MAVTYSGLLGGKTVAGSLKNLVNYERIDPATTITEAEAYIFGALRVREMRKVTTITQTAGTSKDASLPSDFLDPILVVGYRNLGPLQNSTMEELIGRRRIYAEAEDGTLEESTQAYFAIFNDKINFDCVAEETVTYTMAYYGSNALSLTNETNFLTIRYPSILLAAVRYYAYLHMENDTEAGNWKKITDELIARANIETDFTLRGADFMVTVR